MIDVEGAQLRGLAQGDLPGRQLPPFVAIRPDDLMLSDSGGNALQATVETIEYRGREFVGTARSSQGADFVFPLRTIPSSRAAAIHLTVDGERVLIFADQA